MQDINLNLNDATAYESYIKYPTDEKLLWDCNIKIYKHLFVFCKDAGIIRPRNDFLRQDEKQLKFSKRKKKPFKLKRKRRKSLLYLLNKGIELVEDVLKKHINTISEKNLLKYYSCLPDIQTVYTQQKYMYDEKVSSVKNRIVSLFKPYIRPIVRGKENKRVEFGPKVQMSQVDNINFIDYICSSFSQCLFI